MNVTWSNWLHDTISALVYSSAGSLADPAFLFSQPPYNDLTHFVAQQQESLPDYLRLPMATATLGFDLYGLLRNLRLFHSRPPEVRAKQTAAWKRSRLSAARDLVRYYESLTVFGLYSRSCPALQTALSSGLPDTQDRRRIVSHPESELECDIVVVGSGPGGAITAAVLAEAGRDVLLVEEGAFYSIESSVPFSKAEMQQKYRNGGQTVAFGRTKISYVEGCCVGGGSEINSGLYHRTPAEVLEQWKKEFSVEGLTETDLQAHFEAIEKALSISFLPVAAPAASLRLHQGASRLGWKSLEVPRWFAYDTAKPAKGTRQSMTETFIPRFLRSGGVLLPLTRIETIRNENGKWIVTGRHRMSGRVKVTARTVFLAAGAVQTAALLRRNGMTRNIGQSLQVHPTVKAAAEFPEPINSWEMGVPVHQVKEFAPRLSFGCSISTPPYLALGLLDQPDILKRLPTSWHKMANYYAMITPTGRGTIRTFGRYRDPVVNFELTEADRRNLADGLCKLAEVLFAGDAERVYPCLPGHQALRSTADIARLADVLPHGGANLMTIHLFSSCPMGEDKAKCATDSFGRMHGFNNLYVADASLLCGAPGVNPQGSVMAIARRNALHFLGRL